MTINEYQQLALRTESNITDELDHMAVMAGDDYKAWGYPIGIKRVLQGVMGLSGESGECTDIVKKTLFQGHILRVDHLAKELGDVAWYLALAADAIGYDLETIFQMNIDKLKARYPDGFDEELSKHRKEGDV